MISPLRLIWRWTAKLLTFGTWVITLGLIAVLVFAYVLPQDLLRKNQPYAMLVVVSFFGRVLTFHIGLTLSAAAIAAIFLRRKKLLLIAASMALVCLLPTLQSFLPHHLPPASGPTLRVMSMNLKYTQAHPDLIVSQILHYKPDVLALEDYTPFAQTAIETSTGNTYPYRQSYFDYTQGLAIYSRLPFVEKTITTFTITRRQMRTVIFFNGHPIVIYVEHPYSPRSMRRILNNRMATLDLAGQVSREKFPVIAAGDFNFNETTPNEEALKLVGLADAFETAGHGRGSTWPVEPRWKQWLPGVRIDHIFFSRQLTCTWFAVGQYDGSDHLPIIADIAIRN
jgi:endonuclease/exonuclease/phosphatase (EEP) superfamily protein YafD